MTGSNASADVVIVCPLRLYREGLAAARATILLFGLEEADERGIP